jgi:integrase
LPHVFQGFKKDKTPYPRWRFQYTDAKGVRRTAAGYTSRRETEKLAQRVQSEQDCIRKGYRPAPRSSDACRAFAQISAEYQAWGQAQGGRGGRSWSVCHARKKKSHLAYWQEALGLETLADLAGCLPRVEKALRELSERGRTGKTLMNTAETLAAFCDWCLQRGYLAENPIKGLGSFDATPRESRRAMTREEIQRLLAVATEERRILYETAFCTGLRANELRQITAAHLDRTLGGLRLDAAWTKNRKAGLQPLPGPLFDRLVELAKGKAPGEALLYVPSHPARELDKDLTKAGIPKRTADGKLDFHACRVAYTTLVIEAGANVKEAQSLLRHSTPQLTMNVYARARGDRLAEVAERVGAVVMTTCGQGSDVPEASEREEALSENDISPCEGKGLCDLELVEAGGIEPPSRDHFT